VGNPPAQVIKTFTAGNQQGADIAFRPNFTGANNIIDNNFCLSYIQGAGPASAPCPNIKMTGVEEAAQRMASRRSSQNVLNDDRNTAFMSQISSRMAAPMSLVLLGCGVIGGIARQRRRSRHAGRSYPATVNAPPTHGR
ncbi:MAG TPA: hypothetical protein VKE96_19090, partial [Vicinamibacterales bacterium]|nr:hypothetical protein [Vicinamibacterales bacterium]